MGCRDEDDKPNEPEPGQADVGVVEKDASQSAVKLTAQDLNPIIQTEGVSGAIPTSVVVEFSRNVSKEHLTPNTEIVVDPPVEGKVRFSTDSSLKFVPSTPFRPSTTYTVSLKSVDTKDGVIAPETPWQTEFTTPKFEFLELLGGVVGESNNAEVDMRFSAPVAFDDRSSNVSWTLDGKELPNSAVSYAASRAGANSVHVILVDAGVKPGATLEAKFDVGYAGDPKIKTEGKASIALRQGPTVRIEHAGKRQGANGYYIEVGCTDSAVPGRSRWYYTSDGDYHRVSRRCMPTKNSADAHIKVTPKVEGLRVVSGPGGFNIIGEFRRGTYALQIDAGLTTKDGGITRTTYDAQINVPARSPSIQFPNKGRYMSRKGWKELQVKALNVPETELIVRHVPVSNVAFWLSGYGERFDRRTSTIVAKNKIKLGGKDDEPFATAIDVATLVDSPAPGVYQVSASHEGARDATRVVVTDLNLIVKRNEAKKDHQWGDEVVAWVTDMNTNKPKSGVTIELLRLNGTVFSTCKTNSSGECQLEVPPKDIDPEPPFAVTAKLKDDFTFVKFDEVRTSPRVSGAPYNGAAKYQAAIYSDRDVYRPGETGHFVAVVRDGNYEAPKANLPVEIRFRDPKRKVLKTRVLRTNEAGMVTIDQPFPDFAATGRYDFEISIGKKVVSSFRFSVEEFVPERMKVSASMGSKKYRVGSPIDVRVEAKYLFGGSAVDSPIELGCRLSPTEHSTEKWGDYQFGAEISDDESLDLGVTAGTLNQDGVATLQCPPLDGTLPFSGVAELTATAAVFEAGSGRTSNAIVKTKVHASDFHIGIKSDASQPTPGQPINIEGVVVDWDDALSDRIGELKVELIQLEYDYYSYRDNGDESSGQNEQEILESTKKVKVKNGRFKAALTPQEGNSSYLIRVTHGDIKSELRIESFEYRYYRRGHNASFDYTPDPLRPTAVPISAEPFEVGKAGAVKIDVPFSGRLLVSVETDRVLASEWHDVKAGEFSWSYTPKEFVPNVHVTALVIKDPFLDSKEAFRPGRAFGTKSVKIKPTQHTQSVTIAAPEEIRPNSKLDVEVTVADATDETFVTIAAVDEGILSLTKYQSPDPAKQLFSDRRLGVETFETIGWTLQRNAQGPSGRTGGGAWDDDGEFGDGLGRVMPVKPVALWSGVVKVGADGKARVSFDVPTYRGALRIMAVSADKTRTGAADARVKVRDPLVLQTTLPRFLSAEDEVNIPVFVTNMTGKADNISIELASKNMGIPGVESKKFGEAISFLSPQRVNITAKAGESKTAYFKIKALKEAGWATFRVTAKTESEVSFAENDVPFRPSGPKETITQVVELPTGKTDLTSALDGWVPTSESSTIWVTNNPYGRAFDHLKYVIRYPYGCIEQTTSSTRPLLFVSDIVASVDPESVAKFGNIESMVNAGISRIFSMQTESGGFGYWPGASSPDPWGTAYATHMLLDAKDQGYDVPQDQLDDALDYIKRAVWEDGSQRKWGYREAQPYMNYVLARTDRANRSKIQELIDTFPKSDLTGRQKENLYLLQAALFLAGDRKYQKELRKVDVSKLSSERETRWSYYSDLRRYGFVLGIFYDLFGKKKDGEKLARTVANNLAERKGSWRYTTQELAWGLTGLGKWIKGGASKIGKPTLRIDSRTPKPQHAAGANYSWFVPRASEYNSVSVDVPSKNGKVFAIISSTGVREGVIPKAGGNNLVIKRTYHRLDGTELAPNAIKLGDIVYVKVHVQNTSDVDLSNVALVDRFPAGFEVENPRFGRGELPTWVSEDDAWKVDHMNVRDDRVEAFGRVPEHSDVMLVYTVRATSEGRFLAPGPDVAGMYDPDVWARGKQSKIEVKAK